MKTPLNDEKAKTSIKTLEDAEKSLAALEQRKVENDSRHQVERRQIQAEQLRLSEIRQPYDHFCQEIQLAEDSIAEANFKRERCARDAASFRAALNTAIGTAGQFPLEDYILGNELLKPLLGQNAAHCIVEIDRFLSEQATRLTELKKNREDYAKANGLGYLLT